MSLIKNKKLKSKNDVIDTRLITKNNVFDTTLIIKKQNKFYKMIQLLSLQ